MVGPEGMEKFCEDIGVEPENVSIFFVHFGYLRMWFGLRLLFFFFVLAAS